MDYSHTQQRRWHFVLYAVALFTISLSWVDPNVPPMLLIPVSLLFVVFAQSFRTLTVEDAGHLLMLRYGPIPLLSKRIWYESIQSVEVGRLSLIDGWGIQWVPGRGWTYSLWGFDCVKLRVNNRTIRIGTDDAEDLAAFLRLRSDSRSD